MTGRAARWDSFRCGVSWEYLLPGFLKSREGDASGHFGNPHHWGIAFLNEFV